MRAALATCLLLVALLAPGVSAAPTDGLPADAQDRLMGLLRAYEHQPTAEEFKALGEGVREALIAVAQDGDEVALVRGRAAFALAFYPDATARQALEGLLAQPELSDLILRRALDALARAFPDTSVSHITPYLDDGRTELREAAAKALGMLGTPAALRALRRRAARERDDAVRTVLEGEIARLEGSAAAE
jgi:HEAT repeat protein